MGEIYRLTHIHKPTYNYIHIFPDGSAVKNPPAMQESQEMQVWSLSQKDPLEEGTATRSSILAWRIPWTIPPRHPMSIGLQRSNLAYTFMLYLLYMICTYYTHTSVYYFSIFYKFLTMGMLLYTWNKHKHHKWMTMLILIDLLIVMTHIKVIHPSPVHTPRTQRRSGGALLSHFFPLDPFSTVPRTYSGCIFYFLTVNIGRNSWLLNNLFSDSNVIFFMVYFD